MAGFLSAFGFPDDPSSNYPPPGLANTTVAVQPAPQISSIQSVWNTITNDSQSAFSWVEDEAKNLYGGIKDIGSTIYGDAKSAAGTIYDDVSRPITNAISSTYWYLIIAVVVVGGVIYFAGKSGAVSFRV